MSELVSILQIQTRAKTIWSLCCQSGQTDIETSLAIAMGMYSKTVGIFKTP